MAFGWPRIISIGVNGFVRPEWDPADAVARLRFQDMSAGGADPLLTPEELFEALWNKVIKHIDQTHR
ncbi:MAG TPA: hypothetical protein VGN81_06885 [Pseudonocardiaceae bacterium]|jgi:hypothetical protein